jgi:DNA-binding winged helix-turn-helix (wHTH) protein
VLKSFADGRHGTTRSAGGGAMQAVRGKAFFFQGYTLDLRRGCLRHEDREIELRPKSFTVLRYLVENAGRLVSKDELIRAVWPNVVVTDDSLTRCMSDVRLALEDREQRIIKTVPRRGYLLAALVSPAIDAALARNATSTTQLTTPAATILVERRVSRTESVTD